MDNKTAKKKADKIILCLNDLLFYFRHTMRSALDLNHSVLKEWELCVFKSASACVELWHRQMHQMFLMSLLEGSFSSLSHSLWAIVCVCMCVWAGNQCVWSEDEGCFLVTAAPHTHTAPSSYKQYVAVYVAMLAAAFEDLIKASMQQKSCVTTTHCTEGQSCWFKEIAQFKWSFTTFTGYALKVQLTGD